MSFTAVPVIVLFVSIAAQQSNKQMADLLEHENVDGYPSGSVSADAGDSVLLDQSNGNAEEPDPVNTETFLQYF